MKNIREYLKTLDHAELTSKVNYLLIPVTVLNSTPENAELFNEILTWLKSQDLGTITRTPSGGVSTALRNLSESYDMRHTSSCVELTIILLEGIWRIQFRGVPAAKEPGQKTMYGRRAFEYFRETCSTFGICLENYAVSNGREIKKEIPRYMVCYDQPEQSVHFIGENHTLEHCYHVDFHSSFPAGLVYTHPEFAHVINHFYEGRKVNPIYKEVLNFTIGYMQNAGDPKFAQLSKDAIVNNNRRVYLLAKRVKKAGYRVLIYNTDGFWYQDLEGDKGAYHGHGEGKKLGQWHNDHEDVKMRIKSVGAYEFIENGKYNPVIRGRTNLDSVKDRSEWMWGDIFHTDADVLKFKFDKEKGIIL